jgi:transposase
MRGAEPGQRVMFSYVDLEQRIPDEHPLRAIQALAGPVLRELAPRFAPLYADSGRPSLPPEQLLRALLLQVLYTIRSERRLMEQLDYNLLFRWFVGLGLDAPVWHPTTFTKNRDRLLAGQIAEAFLAGCCGRRGAGRCSRRTLHGGRDPAGGVGQPEELSASQPAAAGRGRRSGQSDREFPGRAALQCDPSLDHRPRRPAGQEGGRERSQAQLSGQRHRGRVHQGRLPATRTGSYHEKKESQIHAISAAC